MEEVKRLDANNENCAKNLNPGIASRKRIKSFNFIDSKYSKFDGGESICELSNTRLVPEHRYFVAQFILPSTSLIRSRFLDNGDRVCLKSFTASRWHLSGTILASDPGVAKRVFVRYTLDDWHTSTDTEATFLDSDQATGSDRYHFRLDFPFRLPNETKLQLAVACSIFGGQTNWDNNGGLNYIFNYTSTFTNITRSHSAS